MALQYPGVSSITRMGVVFDSATIHPPLRFKRAGRVCDLLVFVRAHARARLIGNAQSNDEVSLVANNTVLAEGEVPQSSETEVTGVADVEIRSSDCWQGEPRRRCNAPRYDERRHDSDPDSCRPLPLVS